MGGAAICLTQAKVNCCTPRRATRAERRRAATRGSRRRRQVCARPRAADRAAAPAAGVPRAPPRRGSPHPPAHAVTVVLATLAALAAAAGLTDVIELRRRRPKRRSSSALRAVARIGAKLGVNPSGGLAARVAAAGIDRPTSEIVALQAGLALIATLATIPTATLAPGRLGLALLLAAPACGYLAPEYALRARARARGKAMEAELPDVLDLLRVAIAAGLAPRRALQEVGRRHPGLLAQELRRTAGRAAMGEPVERALTQLEARSPANGITQLVAALRRAERHGAPLGAALAAQAAEARSLRAAHRSEQAAKAAPKIQLVVALVLVPAVLLLVAAALLPALTTR